MKTMIPSETMRKPTQKPRQADFNMKTSSDHRIRKELATTLRVVSSALFHHEDSGRLASEGVVITALLGGIQPVSSMDEHRVHSRWCVGSRSNRTKY